MLCLLLLLFCLSEVRSMLVIWSAYLFKFIFDFQFVVFNFCDVVVSGGVFPGG